MQVVATQKGFYGGELRIPGEKFEVENEDVEAAWFEPVDKSIIAKREAAKKAEAEKKADGEESKDELMAKAHELGLTPHPSIGIPKLKEAIAKAEAEKKADD